MNVKLCAYCLLDTVDGRLPVKAKLDDGTNHDIRVTGPAAVAAYVLEAYEGLNPMVPPGTAYIVATYTTDFLAVTSFEGTALCGNHLEIAEYRRRQAPR